jgi:hypothetical protein
MLCLPGKHSLYVWDEALLFFRAESDGSAHAQVLRVPGRGVIFEQLEHLAEHFTSVSLRLNGKFHCASTKAGLHEVFLPIEHLMKK